MNEHNADYVDCFALQFDKIEFPTAERSAPGKLAAMLLEGTKFKFKPNVLLQRTTKTNKIRVGVIMLRYAKGRPLAPDAGAWQSAAAYSYLRSHCEGQEIEPDLKLCLTIDVVSGIAYPAPTNSIYRFNEIKAACATIAERWPQIKPPKGAVI